MIKAVFNGFIWSSAGRLVNAVTKFFSVPLLLTYFGKENYALLALALSVNIYAKIMDLGFNTGNVKFISSWIPKNENEKINKLVQSSISFYSIIGIINFIILLVIANYSDFIFKLSPQNDLILKKLFYVLSVTSVISWGLSITSQVLKAYERIDYEERLILITNILTFLLVLFTVYFELDLYNYFLIYSILLVIMLPVRLFKCMSLNKSIKFKINWHPTIFKEVLRYSLGVFLLGIFQFSATNLRPIIVGIQSDILNVADYRIMQQITALILIFTGSFMGILLPIISKLDPLKDIQLTKNIVTEYTKIISLLLTSLVFGFILISKPFIILYLGEEYLEIRMWLIIWSLSVLGTHNTAISALILAQKSLKPITYFTMFSSVISLLACWFITPYYGVGGAVISLVIYIFLQLLFYYSYYIPKVMKFDAKQIFIYSFSIPALIGLFSAIIVQLLSLPIKFDNFMLEIIGKSLSFLIIFLFATNLLSIKLSKIKSTLNFKI